MSHTFVIAEAGSCHDGVFEKAVSLIDVARIAGADAFKAQFWSSAKRLADRRQADGRVTDDGLTKNYIPIYEKYQIPATWLPRLREECSKRGLEFMCTAYLPEDIEVVAPYVKRFKVASFEAGDAGFVFAHLAYGKPLIVSTGMGGDSSVATTVLHCVSAYPAPLDEANLAVLRLPNIDGFSDHTKHLLTGAFAVCAGATVLEVHMRDWITAMDNPDYPAALDPSELHEYIRLVRLAETMLGDGVKRCMPSEAEMARYRVVNP